MTGPARKADWTALAALVLLWGSSFAMSKHAVVHLSAEWVMALRLAVAAVVLVPYAELQGQSLAASPRTWTKYVWLGFIGYTLPFYLVTWGMHFITSGVAGLLMAAIPLFVIVLAHWTLPDERLNLTKGVGFLLGFAGIVVLIGPEALFTFSFTGEELVGEVAVLLACLCYAVHGISAKRLGFDHPVKQSASVCLAGAIIGVAGALAWNPGGLQDIPASAFAAVFGLGLLPTAIATLLVYRIMERTGPSFVSYSNYLVPVFAVLLGAAALGEKLDWSIVLALILVLSGIAISRIRPAKEGIIS